LWMVNSGFTYQQSRPGDVRLDANLGGGSLWDIGCYAVNAVRLVVQAEPHTALAMAIGGPGPDGDAAVDQAFIGLLRFPNNIVATIHSSFRAEYRTWLEVSGAAGVMRVPNPFRPRTREEIEVERGAVVNRIPVDGSPTLFVRQVDDFVAAALDGRPPAVSLADSRGNAAALAALHASAKTGAAVTI
jgi:xylose dehydrogenase (NAD/NADP)